MTPNSNDNARATSPGIAMSITQQPNLTPAEVIRLGSFGGTYFSDATRIDVAEFPAEWFTGLPTDMYASDTYNRRVNRHRVKCGSSQADWDAAGWIHPDDPRGWFQWYCRWHAGRTHDDDIRQIRRWLACASPVTGRWTRTLFGKMRAKGADVHDQSVSPVIRQTLLHWAYEPTEADYAAFLAEGT